MSEPAARPSLSPSTSPDDWVRQCQNGDRRAASRLISLLESPDRTAAGAASQAVAHLPFPKQSIGVTGPPGAGKSTLLDYLCSLYRARQKKVGILAIDPSSPFTGGALLGDRIRMGSHAGDSGVFIRSMGSRGASGALAAAASDALRVLAAAGYDPVFIETVGAGQAETEVVNLADTVCVVQVPGLGDDVQLMKMGMLEIADVFAVNKGDKPEAQDLKLQLELALQESDAETCRAFRQLGKTFAASYSGPRWHSPVVLLSALRRENGQALMDALDAHLAFLQDPVLSISLKRERLKRDLIWRASKRLQDSLLERLSVNGDLFSVLEDCISGTLSLDKAVERVLGSGNQ